MTVVTTDEMRTMSLANSCEFKVNIYVNEEILIGKVRFIIDKREPINGRITSPAREAQNLVPTFPGIQNEKEFILSLLALGWRDFCICMGSINLT